MVRDARPYTSRSTPRSPTTTACWAPPTTDELATFFDVAVRTVDGWLRVHPEFAQAVQSGRAIADAEIAHRLYQRAMGYDYAAHAARRWRRHRTSAGSASKDGPSSRRDHLPKCRKCRKSPVSAFRDATRA